MPTQSISANPKVSFDMISTIFILFMVYFQLNQGIEKGNSFFRQSDVNFIFTAPISPKKTLIYGFIKELLKTIFFVFLIILQIPNLKNFYPVTGIGVVIIFLTVFLLSFTMGIFSIVIYSITSKKKRNRLLAKRCINGLFCGIGVWFLVVLSQMQDLIKASDSVFNSNTFNILPIIGWFKVVLSYATKEIDLVFYIYLSLLLVTVIILIIVLYYVNTDYYEDVLAATERKEKLYLAKKSGSRVREIKENKVKKVNQGFGSGGAKAIFYKHIIEYRKNGFFFVGKETIGIVVFGFMSKYMTHSSNIKSVLYFSIYMLFIFSLQGKWIEEMKMHYIYIIPADSIEKVFWGTLANHLKNFVDGLILFSITAFMFKQNVIIILLSALTYTTFGALFVYTDVLTRRVFGSTHSKVFKFLTKFILVLLIILPSIIGSSIIEHVILKSNLYAPYIGYGILIAYNIVISFILILSGRKVFEVAEI
jgi:hypothetical protein